jgi:hypothetical protein
MAMAGSVSLDAYKKTHSEQNGKKNVCGYGGAEPESSGSQLDCVAHFPDDSGNDVYIYDLVVMVIASLIMKKSWHDRLED